MTPQRDGVKSFGQVDRNYDETSSPFMGFVQEEGEEKKRLNRTKTRPSTELDEPFKGKIGRH